MTKNNNTITINNTKVVEIKVQLLINNDITVLTDDSDTTSDGSLLNGLEIQTKE